MFGKKVEVKISLWVERIVTSLLLLIKSELEKFTATNIIDEHYYSVLPTLVR